MTETDFAEFYSTHFRRLAAQLYAYLGDHAEAQDITQEAFCRALDRWRKVSTLSDPVGWVRRVGWNLATSRLRHLNVIRRHLVRQRIEHVDGPSPDRVALVGALAGLPAKHRLAVVLHHLAQLSTAEIAQQEGVAEGTVRSWLSRGRAGLAAQFEESLTAATADVQPPGVQAATAAVRRRRTARRATLAAVLVIVLAVPVAILLRTKGDEPPIIGPTPSPSPSPSPTAAPQAISACTGRYLPLPQGRLTGHLEGGDSTGRYLVGSAGNLRDDVPVLWDGDQIRTITVPGRIVTGIAVNSSGVVAGSASYVEQARWQLWTWREGELTVLLETDDPQQAVSVVDFNNRGDMLLKRNNGNVVREAGTGAIRELPRPTGASGMFANDLSEDGTVVGWDDRMRALVWTVDGAVRALAGPQGMNLSATAINGPWVVGTAAPAQERDLLGQNRHAIRWDLHTGDYILLDQIRHATAVTPHGWVVAHTQVEIKDSPTHSSFLYPPVVALPGARVALPAPTGSRQNDFNARVISDDGRVIAGEGKLPGTGHGTVIRWTCS